MTNELWPIVVPSYKRGSNAKTLQMLKNGYDKRLNLFLFIYPDDADNYRDIIDSKLFTVVYCEGFRGIVPKRNFINNEMYKRGYENIFVLDDDIPSVHKLEPGVQKKNPNAYRSIKLQTTPYDFFEAFQSIIENADKHLTQTGCVNEMEAAFNDFRKKPSVIYTRFPIQMVHICTKDVIENNKAFIQIVKIIKNYVKHEKTNGSIVYGLESPVSTAEIGGFLWTITGILNSGKNTNITVDPVFNQFYLEFTIDTNFEIKLLIPIIKILKIIIRNPTRTIIIKLIKILRKKDESKGEN